MEAFKRVMDSASKIQMDYFFLQYPGYFRFAKWMERLAQGIADGVIEVPKEHYKFCDRNFDGSGVEPPL
ncbi:TPA: arylsulfatase [Raoultella ornithinolytica]|nr:arylsulfatase [Raoultella ornithinolytica]